jgi:hypothetical protein
MLKPTRVPVMFAISFAMLWPVACCVALWGGTTAYPEEKAAAPPVISAGAPEKILEEALGRLEGSGTGRELLAGARVLWHEDSRVGLRSHFRLGAASRTDAVLIRHFDPDTGEESRERNVTVYLRLDQPLAELTLDMAHELVHATARPAWDPYDPDLSAGKYIQSAIEGEGGEVEAVRHECLVGYELHYKKVVGQRCRDYGKAPDFATSRIRQDFYRIGKWKAKVVKMLGTESSLFPELSSEKPALFSSTGGTPYPAALLEEFRGLTQIACGNMLSRKQNMDERRGSGFDSVVQTTVVNRAPASEESASAAGPVDRFLKQRCR